MPTDIKDLFEGRFPDWQKLYKALPPEQMPWYHPDLDPDLAAALQACAASGGSFLDLGTGPGTQAMELAARGFKVTASDLSQDAVDQAAASAASRGLTDIVWQQDDILQSKLEVQFDFIFDRGCFHCLDPKDRPAYVRQLRSLLAPQGTYFLKCFSADEPPAEVGPWRFTREDLQTIFGKHFVLAAVKDTVYQGTMERKPLALFAVMRPAQ